LLKKFIFALVYISFISAADAYTPLDGVKAATNLRIAEGQQKASKPSSNMTKPLSDSLQSVSEKPEPASDDIRGDELETGIRKYRERKYAEAISALSRHLSLVPDSQQRKTALLIIGKSLEEMNRPLSALNIYGRVTEQNPDSPEALLGMVAMADIGVALPGLNYRSGKRGAQYFRDPVAAYDIALFNNVPSPIVEHIHLQRGRSLWRSKRYEQAHRQWRELLKTYPKTMHRQETIGFIRECTAVLIDRYSQSEDHIAVADLFLQGWKEGFIRTEDVDILSKVCISLSRLGLQDDSLNILNALRKSALGNSPLHIDKIDRIVSEADKRRTSRSSEPRSADAKWSQFQSGRQYLRANRPALAEKPLADLKIGGGDPFWSKIADYALDEYRWAQKYQGQIGQ
jgi:tetratricopeptide (TPR) repeat protein